MHRLCLTKRFSSIASQLQSSKAQVQAKINEIDAIRPFSPALVDRYARKHDYLRISLTERCNLRCFYCMPEEGIDLSPPSNLLTTDEVVRLASLFVRSGVSKIRLTGGEPTVRKDIVDIVARLSKLRSHGLKEIAMTSNGLALQRKLPDLLANGLSHLNLSLDTLDPHKFELMTRRRGHDAVLRCLDAALLGKLMAVKLNVVVVKGLNDSEVLEFIELTRGRNLCVRFIEYMPFSGNQWKREKMIPSSGLLHSILERHPLSAPTAASASQTASTYRVPGFKGTFGFISSMSDQFCATCNRLRLTADGQIKVCLFDPKEVSLRDRLRSGASDAELLTIIGKAVGDKQAKHAGMDAIDVFGNRPMIKIAERRTNWQIPTTSILSHSVLSPKRAFSTSSLRSALTHIDDAGRPNMVNVTEKNSTHRRATASGSIYLNKAAFDLLEPANRSDDVLTTAQLRASSKGNVLITAQLAAIMGCKQTSTLIPLCHNVFLTKVAVDLTPDRVSLAVRCTATVTCTDRTGVEMEALTAVSIGLLTVWDMLKAVAGKDMTIGDIKVIDKSGGKEDFLRK